MTSEIINFFKNENVFVTGGTGFLGVVMVEKLLRQCEINKLYLLIRPKKNLQPEERLQKMFNVAIFDKLKTEKPDYLNKIEIVKGDMTEENLGISKELEMKLIKNVTVVIHSAATVRFDEPIKLATEINVKGTISVIKLCHKMENLQSFVHISTAYSNCPNKRIEERFYDPPINCNTLIDIVEKLDEQKCNILEPKILGPWPNTYVFTKAVAEQAVRMYAADLPVCIVRPAIVTALAGEPYPGWVGNFIGLNGLAVGAGLGLIRVMFTDEEAHAPQVPADMSVNCTLAAAYRTSLRRSPEEIAIYNFSINKDNVMTWGFYGNTLVKLAKKHPFEKRLLPDSVVFTSKYYLYMLIDLFCHLIPALLYDIGLFVVGEKPGMLNIYQNSSKQMDALKYFSVRTWVFADGQLRTMWNELGEVDRKLFDFDMSSLNWNKYLDSLFHYVRVIVMKKLQEGAKRRHERNRAILKLLLILLTVFVGSLVFYFKLL